jgi:hypothetical protein
MRASWTFGEEPVEVAAVVISIVALATSVFLGWKALTLARHSNTMPVLIELFGQHRNKRLADARQFIYHHLDEYDLSLGLDGLPAESQELVRELAWFYDNLGALVAHGVVDVAPVSGYLGQSVVIVWEKLQPLIKAERDKRRDSYDPERWQIYFENLYHLIREQPPEQARSAQHMWRVSPAAPQRARRSNPARLPA